MSGRGGSSRVVGLVAALALAASGSGCVTFWQGLTPQGPPAESESARRLRPGPWPVERRDLRLVDASRATPANGDYAGAPSRALDTTVWLPDGAPGRHPLVIYSHGLLSERREADYLGEHLASHGYVVASADFPLSSRHAPGGPTLRDIAHQPGDVSFLIDSLLRAGGAPEAPEAPEGEGALAPLAGRIDAGRIGAVGLSLGGLTSTLVAFHPELRDARVRAAVSIAGPVLFFSPRFFATARVPFLLIAATGDALVQYESNGATLPERAPRAARVTLDGASHTGFAGIAARAFRFWPNPDTVGCWYLRRRVDLDLEEEDPFAELGGERSGLVLPAEAPEPCVPPPEGRAMRPRRQQVLTMLAVRAFLDGLLGAGEEVREQARRYLAHEFAAELEEVAYRAGGSGTLE